MASESITVREIVNNTLEHSARNETYTYEMAVEPIGDIHPSALNPRKDFDREALDELADSIREHGILEPLVVRKRDAGGYEIICGERRWRAAKLAGLEAVPVRLLRDVDDRKLVELALVENLARRDIDPIEEARGYQALRDLGYKVEEVAQKVGRHQSTISNSMSILRCPDKTLELVSKGKLSPSHARALVPYVNYPELEGTLRELAVAGVPSKVLEAFDIHQLNWEVQSKLKPMLRSLENARIDTSGCTSDVCPHRRKRYCLNPACFDAKIEEAQEARRAEVEARVAEVGEGNTVDLGTLDWDDYEGVDPEYLGCPGDCPHLKLGTWAGIHHQQVCLDKKCAWERRVAADEREKAANLEVKARQLERTLHAMSNDPDAAAKLRAIAVCGTVSQLYLSSNSHIMAHAARHLGIDVDVARLSKLSTHSHSDDGKRKLLEALAEIAPEQLVILVAETALRVEIARGYGKSIMNDWLCGAAGTEPEDKGDNDGIQTAAAPAEPDPETQTQAGPEGAIPGETEEDAADGVDTDAERAISGDRLDTSGENRTLPERDREGDGLPRMAQADSSDWVEPDLAEIRAAFPAYEDAACVIYYVDETDVLDDICVVIGTAYTIFEQAKSCEPQPLIDGWVTANAEDAQDLLDKMAKEMGWYATTRDRADDEQGSEE